MACSFTFEALSRVAVIVVCLRAVFTPVRGN
jgi:hypothetical protein